MLYEVTLKTYKGRAKYYDWDKNHKYPFYDTKHTHKYRIHTTSIDRAELWVLLKHPKNYEGCSIISADGKSFLFIPEKGVYKNVNEIINDRIRQLKD